LTSLDFAELYIVFMQTQDFPDLTLEKNKNAIAIIDLEEHFEFEEECYFNVSSNKNNLQFHIDSNNLLDIYPSADWTGKEKVFVKLTCGEEEIDDDFYVDVVDSISSTSGGGDSEGVEGNNPDVVEGGSEEVDESGSSLELFEILNPLPDKYLIALSKNEEEIFSIDNNDYELIEWHIDGELIDNDFNSYKFKSPEDGKHIIKVIIKKGSLSDSNTWKAVVKDSLENTSSPEGFGKKVIFYLMIVAVLIIVGLCVVLFLKRDKNIS